MAHNQSAAPITDDSAPPIRFGLESKSQVKLESESKQHENKPPFEDDSYTASIVDELTSSLVISSSEENTPESESSEQQETLQQSEALPNWTSLIQKLKLRGLVKQLAQQSELLVFEDRYIELRCENRALASNSMALNGLESAINTHFSNAPKVLKMQVGTVQSTPAKAHAQAKEIELAGAQAIIAQDETIQSLVREFDGMVLPNSVKGT